MQNAIEIDLIEYRTLLDCNLKLQIIMNIIENCLYNSNGLAEEICRAMGWRHLLGGDKDDEQHNY